MWYQWFLVCIETPMSTVFTALEGDEFHRYLWVAQHRVSIVRCYRLLVNRV